MSLSRNLIDKWSEIGNETDCEATKRFASGDTAVS